MRDVIVIGAGGGGGVVAKELAARGLDVLVLEAGAYRSENSRLENDASNPLTGYFRFGPADRNQPAYRRELFQNSAIAQVSGVGGTTQHYFGNSPRAMPGVFAGYDGEDASAYDVAHRFPFRYRDLIPYYEWVEHTLPIQTAPMGTKEQVFLDGAAAIGLPVQKSKDITRAAFRPQENAILQPRGTAGKTDDPQRLKFPLAFGCTFCGHCIQGCELPRDAPRNLRAKRSTDNSYVPMALTADAWGSGGKAITLVTDAFVSSIDTGSETTDSAETARSVTWRVGATGEIVTEEARVIVMACGAIETPRLWLMSGLPNPNGWIGRGLTEHFFDAVVAVMPFETGVSKGPGSGARADYPGRGALFNAGAPPAFLGFAVNLSDAGMAGLYDNGLPGGANGADAVGRLIGTTLKDVLANLDRLSTIVVLTDDDVEAQNGVSLSTTMPPDEHGPIPRVVVNHRARSARTLANREFLVAEAVRMHRALGARAVYRLRFPSWMVHIHSTMRMGLDAADSVLDDGGEARWVKRLFVADNSALANALGGPNPTLTTQALATRTAEKIFERYFDGAPWVGREAPVTSIDPSVTVAVVQRGIG